MPTIVLTRHLILNLITWSESFLSHGIDFRVQPCSTPVHRSVQEKGVVAVDGATRVWKNHEDCNTQYCLVDNLKTQIVIVYFFSTNFLRLCTCRLCALDQQKHNLLKLDNVSTSYYMSCFAFPPYRSTAYATSLCELAKS